MRSFLALALLAYPAIVFLFAESAGPVVTACLFALVAGGRLLLAENLSQNTIRLLIVALIGLCLVTAFIQSVVAVKFYPAAISAAAALWCAYTLTTATSAIERLLNAINRTATGLPKQLRDRIPHAAISGVELAPSNPQRRYMYGLTQTWLVFFSLNSIVSIHTAIAMSTGAWALYNGVISYLLIALLLFLEMAYRGVYQRRHEEEHAQTSNPDLIESLEARSADRPAQGRTPGRTQSRDAK